MYRGPTGAARIGLRLERNLTYAHCCAVKSKAEDYRRNAEAAEEQAEKAIDLEAKRTWRTVADHWRAMAEQADRLRR